MTTKSAAISSVLVATLALAAGCGSGGSSSSSATTPSALLAKIPGCANITPDNGPQLLDRESADCDFGTDSDGDPISLTAVTFTDNKQRDQWLKIGSSLAGGVYVEGDRWVVQTNTSGQAATVKAAIGGTVH